MIVARMVRVQAIPNKFLVNGARMLFFPNRKLNPKKTCSGQSLSPLLIIITILIVFLIMTLMKIYYNPRNI